jgi:hypothetical protein
LNKIAVPQLIVLSSAALDLNQPNCDQSVSPLDV